MAAIDHTNFLNELSGVLNDAGFVVTPDQVVQAHAVLLRLGTDRSPSGLVGILAPLFCESAEQQDQFAGLFIRALDLSDPLGVHSAGGNPYVVGRAVKTVDNNAARRAKTPARHRAEAPRQKLDISRPTVIGAVAVMLLIVFVWVAAWRQPGPTGEPDPGKATAELLARKAKVPKSLPSIGGHSVLDIDLDPSARQSESESLLTKSPWLGAGFLGVIYGGLWAFMVRRRNLNRGVAKPIPHSVVPETPRVLRYGKGWSVAAANRFLSQSADSPGRTIDVPASLAAHVRLGYWAELARARPMHPEYVAIAQRPSANNARSLVTHAMIRRLRYLGVSVDTFHHRGDPRYCVAEGGGKPITLHDLARERGDDRLLLFSDGKNLVDAKSGETRPWVSTFRIWQWRRLAPPLPALRAVGGSGLRRVFEIAPAGFEAIARFGLSVESDTMSESVALPEIDDEHQPSVLADRLEQWLSQGAFQWLATCALYSEVNGALTLVLGELPELGMLTEEDLDKVLALPYTRGAGIPDPLRLELLARLDPKVAAAARAHLVSVLRESVSAAAGPAPDAFKVEYAAQKWLASRDSKDREELVAAARANASEPIGPESALYALAGEVLPFWTVRRKRGVRLWSGAAAFAALGVIPFLPLFSRMTDVHSFAAKPSGTDFGEWICFTKIEQTIDWHLPPGTEIQKLAIEGYDQTASGEGFQLVSRAEPGVAAGPMDRIESGNVRNASLVFAPLHAREYTGVLDIDTNHGRVQFNLRGTGVYSGQGCVDEGHGDFGLESDFNGGGCNQISRTNGVVTAILTPARSTNPSETHSALVLGPWRQGDFDLQCGVRTIAQVRDPAPNPWEVGWVIWNFVDLKHFYYLALKANGWELGRKDETSPAGQHFLATKDYPQFPPGRRYFVHIARRGDSLSVDVDGQHLVSIDDKDHPVTSGRIGLYSECAATTFDALDIR